MDSIYFKTPHQTVSVFYCSKLTLPQVFSNAVYVADTNTVPLLKQAENFCTQLPVVVIKAGEGNKSLSSVEKILETALEAGLDRHGLFIGVGGGVICDMTCFAASIYMRGAQCKLVPTSLLAMADASIGGKTGVNFRSYKNIAGTFFHASEIYITPAALKTLSSKEYFCGLAEIFKMGLLCSKELFTIFKTQYEGIISLDEKLILQIIKLSVAAKISIIENDFYENDKRAILNLGHTFAHALETWSGFSVFTHGEAVAWGISRALELGLLLQKTEEKYALAVMQLLKKYGWDTATIPEKVCKFIATRTPSVNRFESEFADDIVKIMQKDKKNRDRQIRLILQRNICETFIQEVTPEIIKKVLV